MVKDINVFLRGGACAIVIGYDNIVAEQLVASSNSKSNISILYDKQPREQGQLDSRLRAGWTQYHNHHGTCEIKDI